MCLNREKPCLFFYETFSSIPECGFDGHFVAGKKLFYALLDGRSSAWSTFSPCNCGTRNFGIRSGTSCMGSLILQGIQICPIRAQILPPDGQIGVLIGKNRVLSCTKPSVCSRFDGLGGILVSEKSSFRLYWTGDHRHGRPTVPVTTEHGILGSDIQVTTTPGIRVLHRWILVCLLFCCCFFEKFLLTQISQ
jgi:hypothetical protein